MKKYAQFERHSEDISLSWLALLFAILGTAAIALEPDSPILHNISRKPTVPEKILDISTRYRKAAFQCLEADQYMWRYNLETLQALIILIYGINHSHGSSWALMGLAHNVALGIGCHVDPSHFNLDIIECEERRRCWSGLMMLYTLQNATLGHLGPHHKSLSSSTLAPADINDDELVPGFSYPSSVTERATQMSYVLFKFRVYEILSDICETVMTTDFPSIDKILLHDQAITLEQSRWERKFTSTSYGTSNLLLERLHHNILYSTSYHLTLLLHQSIWPNPSHGESLRDWSAGRVLHSARKLLDLYSDFASNQAFTPFRWYLRGIGSFHAFHAAIVLFTLIPRDAPEFCPPQIIKSLDHCLKIFESLAEVSNICFKASPLLRSLL